MTGGWIYLGVIKHMNKEKQSRDDYGVMKMTLHRLLMWKKSCLFTIKLKPPKNSSSVVVSRVSRKKKSRNLKVTSSTPATASVSISCSLSCRSGTNTTFSNIVKHSNSTLHKAARICFIWRMSRNLNPNTCRVQQQLIFILLRD